MCIGVADVLGAACCALAASIHREVHASARSVCETIFAPPLAQPHNCTKGVGPDPRSPLS